MIYRLALIHVTLIVLPFLLTVSPSEAAMQDYPTVKLQALDKSTARTVTLEAKVGTTIEHGSLFIKIQSCRKSQPLEKPESASFLQIWEVPIDSDKSEWIFSGWMFASSPALSAMDHPVYDVWVLDCIDREKQAVEAAARAKTKADKKKAEEEAVKNSSEAEDKSVESTADDVPGKTLPEKTQAIDNVINSVLESTNSEE